MGDGGGGDLKVVELPFADLFGDVGFDVVRDLLHGGDELEAAWGELEDTMTTVGAAGGRRTR
jgi:hypothetical protein